MELKERQCVEEVSIKCDQLISLLMVLGTHAKDIETEELSSTIFLARNIAQEIDNFVENLRLGNS